MLNLGKVNPGSTIRIPFSTFDKDDGSSITMTSYAAADILVYKDGSTTERASTAGFTATTDFDAKTGKHVAIIDLADNTTAGFFSAGSEYIVAIDAVTVDAVTTGGWIARFCIGYEGAILDTTIATLASQTSFTLTSGPAEDDALNGSIVRIHDVASAVQSGYAVVQDYTGSTKTVTLLAGTTFTAAATDNISFFPPVNASHWNALPTVALPLSSTTAGRTLDVSAGGEAGVDWANIGSPTTANNLSGTNIDVDQVVASVSGAVGGVTGHTPQTADHAASIAAIKVKTDNLPSDPADQSIIVAATDAILAAVGDVPTNAELATALGAADDATLAAIAALNNLSSANVSAAVVTAMGTALTEAYRTAGTTGSVAQLLYEISAHLGRSAISSVTKTTKKIDNSTTAHTFTLDSATAPTSIAGPN